MNRISLSQLLRSEDRTGLSAGVVLASILGFWLFYVAIVSLRATVLDLPSQGELAARRAVVTALGILVTIALWQIIRLFDRRTLLTRIAVTVVAAVPCAFVVAAINYYVFNVYDPSSLFDDATLEGLYSSLPMVQEIAEFAISRYFFLIAWAALYLAMSYANDVAVSERRASSFARAAQEAELRALRYQVNPHFLFNTLNSLSSLVMTGRKEQAETMIMNLATFFRSSLADDPSADVALADEIALQRLYLDMESVRFPDRMSYSVVLPDALANIAVPGLILQPLVENAIKHGVAGTTIPVLIRIIAEDQGDFLRLTVANSGPSRREASHGDGIGLANVRSRIEARFGEQAAMETNATPDGGFRVELVIPKVQHDR